MSKKLPKCETCLQKCKLFDSLYCEKCANKIIYIASRIDSGLIDSVRIVLKYPHI
jgi:hypothetical protein